MLVEERMSRPVITVQPDIPIMDAHQLMRKERIRRLPVVNKGGELIGIVSESDILKASPSQATSLSIWEINYLMSKVTVDEVMTSEVVTVDVKTPIEEAALLMADHKIGGLPVLRDGKLVGIVTETDLFKIFLELMGARDPGVRVTLLVRNVPGELAKLTKAIYDQGGNILALVTSRGEDASTSEITVKVENVDQEALVEAITPVVQKVLDMRIMKPM